MTTKEKIRGEKKFTLWMPAEVHKRLKSRAALKEQTIQKYLLSLIENDDDDLEFEELDEEDLKDIDQGRKEYEAGQYKTLEQVKEEYKCQ
ncbi:MAG TPA: hypothetical protein PL110_20230 [Candidatus Eremiobacteraeota bacterium]|nr:hypothetical protein [Candidatus Eremiobacteraeota bacterium]